MQAMNNPVAEAALVQAALQAFLNALDHGEDALEGWFTPDVLKAEDRSGPGNPVVATFAVPSALKLVG